MGPIICGFIRVFGTGISLRVAVKLSPLLTPFFDRAFKSLDSFRARAFRSFVDTYQSFYVPCVLPFPVL